MLNFIKKQFSFKKPDNLSITEKKQVILLNKINLIFALLALISGIFLFCIAVPESKIILLLTGSMLSLILLLSIYLNYKLHFGSAKYTTLITLLIIVTSMGILFGKNSRIEYFYLFATTLSMVLFSKKKIIIVFWISNLLLFIFIIWFTNEFSSPIEREEPPAIVYFFMPVMVYLLLSFLLNMFKSENTRIESELQMKNEIIQKQSDELRIMDELKSKLYTDISHEIKTPLTLISCPVNELLKTESDPEKKNIYKLVIKNLDRLLHLTNQILKLSDLEMGSFKLKYEMFNFTYTANLCASDFEFLAKSNDIKFKIVNPYNELKVYADPEQIHTILNNLLSNAFKFTNSGGSISVKIKILKQQILKITVKDSGIGILEEDIPLIFNKFFKSRYSLKNNIFGSGLGLELTKRLIDLHGGNIHVKSQIGIGTSFIVTLPIIPSEIDSFTPNTMEKFQLIENQQMEEFTEKNIVLKNKISNDKKMILIADDCEDMLNYLKEILSKEYFVIDAVDGESALQNALDYIPDVIISDIMMPKLDGIEFCKKLRNDEKSAHIPIIFITAKNLRNDRMIGFASGADHYLEKPFNTDELKLILSNILKRQNQMIDYYSKKVFFPNNLPELESEEEKFLKKLTNIIELNIDNSNFCLNDLCNKIGYSRSQLFRKTKALTNTSPNEFIRNIRLKHATILLKNKTGNISDISYAVGFNQPSYFTECFKSLYGLTPSEYTGEN